MILLLLFVLLGGLAQADVPKGFFEDLELFKARSLSLRTEKQRLSSEHSNSVSRLLQFTPGVSLGIGNSQTRERDDLTGSHRSSSNYWRANADWNLFRGFGDLAAWRAARQGEEAQKFQVINQELKTELDGSFVVFQWLYLHEVRGAQEEQLKLKQETMRIGRDRYKQGKIPLQDVVKLEVDLSQQESEVRQSEINLAQNEAAYKAFFVDELKTNRWPFAESQELALSEGLGSYGTKSLRGRASALEYGWLSTRARHLPSLDFSLSYREAPLKYPNAGTWSGQLELSLPLWSRYELASASAASYTSFLEADGIAATAERNDELKRAFLKKKIALSLANLRDARLNQEKSDRLYRDMLRSFQLGRLSTNDLFLEQDRKIRALLSYSSSRLAFHESVMEACALWGLSARACLR